MSLTSNSKTMFRWISALLGDFEVVIADFMSGEDWSFDGFAKSARKQQITLVQLCAQGRGKSKDDQYQRLTHIIIDSAKKFWIPKGQTFDILTTEVKLKRQVGGLYLTYLMYQTQAVYRGNQIMIDVEDFKKIIEFLKSFPPHLKKLQDDCNFLVTYLKLDHAFTFCLDSTRYGIDILTRCYLNVTKGEQNKHLEEMACIRDNLLYCQEGLTMLNAQVAKSKFKETLVLPMKQKKELTLTREYQDFIAENKTKRGESIPHMVNCIREMLALPIYTSMNLKGSKCLDYIKMADARKKIERQYQKAKQKEPKKNTNPYVEDGGIFCRKKDGGQKSANGRKNRAPCTGNLWTYISGDGFGPRNPKEPRVEEEEETEMVQDVQENLVEDLEDLPSVIHEVEISLEDEMQIE